MCEYENPPLLTPVRTLAVCSTLAVSAVLKRLKKDSALLCTNRSVGSMTTIAYTTSSKMSSITVLRARLSMAKRVFSALGPE